MKIALLSALTLILLAVAGAIGYEIGIHHSPSHNGTTSAGTSNSDLTGVFANGDSGTPHYYVSVREGGRGKVKGTVNYAYQDGQTQVVLSFTGTAQDGVATLKPTVVTQSAGSATATSVPSLISMTYGDDSVGLGECTSYLKLASSEADCTFSRTSGSADG